MDKIINFKNDINTEEDDLNWLAINFNIDYLNSLRSKKFKYKSNLILKLTDDFLLNELMKKKKRKKLTLKKKYVIRKKIKVN